MKAVRIAWFSIAGLLACGSAPHATVRTTAEPTASATAVISVVESPTTVPTEPFSPIRIELSSVEAARAKIARAVARELAAADEANCAVAFGPAAVTFGPFVADWPTWRPLKLAFEWGSLDAIATCDPSEIDAFVFGERANRGAGLEWGPIAWRHGRLLDLHNGHEPQDGQFVLTRATGVRYVGVFVPEGAESEDAGSVLSALRRAVDFGPLGIVWVLGPSWAKKHFSPPETLALALDKPANPRPVRPRKGACSSGGDCADAFTCKGVVENDAGRVVEWSGTCKEWECHGPYGRLAARNCKAGSECVCDVDSCGCERRSP